MTKADSFHDLTLRDRLVLALQGTARASAQLTAVTDDQLDEDSLLPDWTRKHVAAHLSYNAKALGRLLDWAATGVPNPMYDSMSQRNAEIAQGAALPGATVRQLYASTAAQLTDKWQTLPQNAWAAEVLTAHNRVVPASETIWMRTREVWIHAVDLNTGVRFDDIPAVILRSLLEDIVASWRRSEDGGSCTYDITSRETSISLGGKPDARTVSGSLAGVVRWASGRGASCLTGDGKHLPDAPRWL
jgi:maleylpyruvate isomerase